MRPGSQAANQRRGSRHKAVLPVRVKGTDSSGKAFEELVHTLDVTATGIRLGSVRRELNVLDEVTVFYRTRKIQFRVVWTKKLKGTSEFQVGLQATTQDREAWGMSFSSQAVEPAQAAPAQAAVAQATSAV
jgi:hypothetical protein